MRGFELFKRPLGTADKNFYASKAAHSLQALLCSRIFGHEANIIGMPAFPKPEKQTIQKRCRHDLYAVQVQYHWAIMQ